MSTEETKPTEQPEVSQPAPASPSITLTQEELKKLIDDAAAQAIEKVNQAKTIQEEVESQLQHATSIGTNLRKIDSEYTAEQFYDDVVNEHEALKMLNGTNKLCLRMDGQDIPYSGDWRKYKIITYHLQHLKDPKAYPKEDMIECIKNWK